MSRSLVLLSLFLILWGCSNTTDISPFGKCVTCHLEVHDEQHKFGCTQCHGGIDSAEEKSRAHQGLEKYPAHPEKASTYCGPCHQDIIEKSSNVTHFTLANSTNKMRKSFGAEQDLTTFTATPEVSYPENKQGLVDNLLRQRCFKCHLYDSGQKYPATRHGQGCTACHISLSGGETAANHVFNAPDDDRCLSCHYGNYVGADYYGRFEHDLNHEYRTPYGVEEEKVRPYGVEYRELSRDIHQKRGLVCIDCHSGEELMLGESKVTCKGCHDKRLLKRELPPRVTEDGQNFSLLSASGAKHLIPLLKHPAHNNSQNISCQACHAQWSFDDRGRNYIRIDADEFDNFTALTVQGNYEVEAILTNNFDFDKDELPIEMTDTLTGESGPGIWMKGYVERRWEQVKLGRNGSGQIVVVRPLLNYSLSWVDEDENLIFDAAKPEDSTVDVQEYTPHTTGAAGMFYEARIQRFLADENRSPDEEKARLFPVAQ